MSKYLDLLIRSCIVTVFACGLWLLLGNSISSLVHESVRKNSVLRKAKRKNSFESNRLMRHIKRALSVVLNKDAEHEVYMFIAGTILLFIFSFTGIMRLEGIFKGLIFSIPISLIPYIILEARLRSVRIGNSYEADRLTTTIINEYKQNSLNMIEAIDRAACSDQLSFFTRNHLLRLSLALKSYRTEEELDEAIKAFVFAYDTQWSILLGMNIKIAAFDGTDVSTSMEDILEELKSVGETIEENKRYNNEAFTMIRFILIPLYLFTIFISITGFGFTLKKFIQYQFFTSIGLNFAILTFSSIAICFIVYAFVKKPKFDL
mgnify:CR=1 FL=1